LMNEEREALGTSSCFVTRCHFSADLKAFDCERFERASPWQTRLPPAMPPARFVLF